MSRIAALLGRDGKKYLPKVEALVIRRGGGAAELKKLREDVDVLSSPLGTTQYVIAAPPIPIKIGRKLHTCYIVDEGTGATCSLVRGQELIELRTSPPLISKIIGSRIIIWGFELETSKRMMAISFLLGGLIFGFLALLV